MLILCPRNYTYAKSFQTTKKHFHYGMTHPKLSYAIEFAVISVLQK